MDREFRELIKEVRKKYFRHDYSMCKTDDSIFLPTDLSLMMQYLYKNQQKKALKEGIISNKNEHIRGLSTPEIVSLTRLDIKRFLDILTISDDHSFEKRLRKIYHISQLE